MGVNLSLLDMCILNVHVSHTSNAQMLLRMCSIDDAAVCSVFC